MPGPALAWALGLLSRKLSFEHSSWGSGYTRGPQVHPGKDMPAHTTSSCFLISVPHPPAAGVGQDQDVFQSCWKSSWGLLKRDAGKGQSPVGGVAFLEQVGHAGRGPRRPDGTQAGLLGQKGTKGDEKWLRKGRWAWSYQARIQFGFCSTPGVGGLC